MSATHQVLLKLLAEAELLIEENCETLANDSAGRRQIVEAVNRLTRKVKTPIERAWDIFFQPHHLSVLQTAWDAGWLRILNDAADTGVAVAEISKATGADEALVRRLVRFLAAAGTVKEINPDTFGATEMTRFFCLPTMAAGLRHAGHDYAVSVSKMPEYFACNGYRTPSAPAHGLYAHAYGSSFFEYMTNHQPVAEAFSTFMAAAKSGKKSWLEVYPLDALRVPSGEDIMLVDVGGGKGHELADLAAKQTAKQLSGKLVLQERSEVIAQVPADWHQLFRAEIHDFFSPQPSFCQHARVYYMRNVLHAWADGECIKILTHISDAMKSGYSTLLINEIVFPDSNISFWGAAFDVTMMAVVSGRERTKKEWEELISSVQGLVIKKIWQLDANGESVIEVEKYC
jgi:hypothetical protein